MTVETEFFVPAAQLIRIVALMRVVAADAVTFIHWSMFVSLYKFGTLIFMADITLLGASAGNYGFVSGTMRIVARYTDSCRNRPMHIFGAASDAAVALRGLAGIGPHRHPLVILALITDAVAVDAVGSIIDIAVFPPFLESGWILTEGDLNTGGIPRRIGQDQCIYAGFQFQPQGKSPHPHGDFILGNRSSFEDFHGNITGIIAGSDYSYFLL